MAPTHVVGGGATVREVRDLVVRLVVEGRKTERKSKV